jgi:hypothetical protein
LFKTITGVLPDAKGASDEFATLLFIRPLLCCNCLAPKCIAIFHQLEVRREWLVEFAMRTKSLLGLTAIIAVVGFTASAKAGVSLNISFGAPVRFTPQVISCPPPVRPCPPVVACPPVVVARPPVAIYRPPVVNYCPPVVQQVAQRCASTCNDRRHYHRNDRDYRDSHDRRDYRDRWDHRNDRDHDRDGRDYRDSRDYRGYDRSYAGRR